MAVIDLTLDGLTLPGLENYTPDFGTKKASNVSVSTEEMCNDFCLSFKRQRPIVITENSTTKQDSEKGDVQADARLIFNGSGLSFALGTPSTAGLRVDVIAGYAGLGYCHVNYAGAGGAADCKMQAGQRVAFVANAALVWEEDTPVAEFYATIGEDKYPRARWLRYDFSASNRKTLKILAGTILQFDGLATPFYAKADVSIDLSEEVTQAGADYNLFLVLTENGYEFHASTQETYTNGRLIGNFCTECAAIPEDTIATIPDSPTDSELRPKLVKPYDVLLDYDFAVFYTLNPTDVIVQTKYDTFSVPHCLAGWEAGDILPESVFCSGWHPADTLHGKGMIYEVGTDAAVDIYLQSGMGSYTRSVFGGVTTRTREAINHEGDFNAVGKRLLTDAMFTNVALGSNEKTAIKGAAESSILTAGGHVDTKDRRMTSFVGAEDCCGGVYQWLREYGPTGGSSYSTYDGHAQFGQSYGVPYQLLAGGAWSDGSSCGSRCRGADDSRSYAHASGGGRGSSRMSATRYPLYAGA